MSADNRRTVAGYELCARGYTEAVAGPPSGNGEVALRRMVELVPAGGTVLEIGSGPGWDADFVESLGVTVRRSDVTRAFVDIQAERGKRAELLDVLHDDIGGPYDAVMALFVLQHIGCDLVDSVLHKVAAAARRRRATGRVVRLQRRRRRRHVDDIARPARGVIRVFRAGRVVS